MENEKSNSNS